MSSETIVAVFDTTAQAESAISALEAGGIPSGAIKHYAKSDMPAAETGTTMTTEHKSGFWAWILGEEGPAVTTDHSLYDRSVEAGGTVVTVIVDSTEAERVMEILEAHDPADLDQRVSSYGLASTVGPSTPMVDTTAPLIGNEMGAGLGTSASAKRIGTDGREEVIALSEESVDVGKRTIDRGTTRLRRYVVERPVEEQIALRNETVSVTRRPVMSGSVAVPGDAFTEKTVEFTEMSEEAVVAKTARVHEEVVVAKQVEDRVETVRDTVRREELEVEKDGVAKTGVMPIRSP